MLSLLAAVLLFAQTAGTYPFVSERTVEAVDLEGLSPEELQIMRNEVFARKGLRFKTPAMKAHFQKQPWYRAESDDVNAKLTALERANVALIKARETELSAARTPEQLGWDLQGAASDGDVAKVKALLRDGAAVDWADDVVGDSAIHVAAQKGHLAVVKALLDAGASVDIEGHQQQTALALAAAANRLEIAKALLKAGANPDKKLTCGTETALTYAKAQRHVEMVKLLVKSGAKDSGTTCTAD